MEATFPVAPWLVSSNEWVQREVYCKGDKCTAKVIEFYGTKPNGFEWNSNFAMGMSRVSYFT